MKIKCLTHNTRPVHWLANPDESEQAVHLVVASLSKKIANRPQNKKN